jgi:hypothetical protein
MKELFMRCEEDEDEAQGDGRRRERKTHPRLFGCFL